MYRIPIVNYLSPKGERLVSRPERALDADTIGRLTSGSYPYNMRSLAAHRERRHKLYMPEQLPVLMPISACGLVRNSSSTRVVRRPEASRSVRAPLQPVQDTTYRYMLAHVSQSGKRVYACGRRSFLSSAEADESPERIFYGTKKGCSLPT